MVSADWDLLDDVHSKVTLGKNNRNWGTAGGNTANNGGNVGAIQSEAVGAGGIQANTFVDQAYVKIDKVMGAVDSTLGRQFYGNSGDMVVYYGPSDKAQYGMPITGIDAARFDWANDMVGLTGIVGKIVGASNAAALPQAGTDLRGIVATLKAKENVSGGLYVYDRVTHNLGIPGVGPSGAGVGGKNDNLWITGIKGKMTMGAAWLGGEFAKNWGENRFAPAAASFNGDRHYKGWAAMLDAGAKADVSGVGALTGWGKFGYGSGDGDASASGNNAFTAIQGDFRPGTIYGRFSGPNAPITLAGALPVAAVNTNGGTGTVFNGNGTLTNRVIYGFGAKVNPSACNKLTAGLSFWDFHSQTAMVPQAPGGAQNRAFAGNKHIGSEWDLDLEWKHSENVSFMTGVARFYAGGAIKEAIQATSPSSNSGIAAGSQNGNSPASLAYFDVRVKF
jgi:hypothetical protein